MIILKGAKEPTADGSIKEQLIGHPYMKFFKLATARFLILAHDQILSRIENTHKRVNTAPCKLRCSIKQANHVSPNIVCLGTLVPNVGFVKGLTSQNVQLEETSVIRHNHKKKRPCVMRLIAHYQGGNAW